MDLLKEKLSLRLTHMIVLKEFFFRLRTIKVKQIGNNSDDRIKLIQNLKFDYGEEYKKRIKEEYNKKVKENTRIKNKVRYLINLEIKKIDELENVAYNEYEEYHLSCEYDTSYPDSDYEDSDIE